jgi:acetyl-CoA carboxylase carboxyl transferase subunit alpha
MDLAARFGLPVLTLVDTPGAYPGVGAEERGQAEAIARNIREMAVLPVPVICVVIGEGGSGGALAIAVGDQVLMMENPVYSVISPRGCASILWRDGSRAPDAAKALRLTAADLLGFRIIDGVVDEPRGGAHQDWDQAAQLLKKAVLANYRRLKDKTGEQLVRERIARLGTIGVYAD